MPAERERQGHRLDKGCTLSEGRGRGSEPHKTVPAATGSDRGTELDKGAPGVRDGEGHRDSQGCSWSEGRGGAASRTKLCSQRGRGRGTKIDKGACRERGPGRGRVLDKGAPEEREGEGQQAAQNCARREGATGAQS